MRSGTFLGPELWTLLRSRWSHGAQPEQQAKCGLKTLGVRTCRTVMPIEGQPGSLPEPAVLQRYRGWGSSVRGAWCLPERSGADPSRGKRPEVARVCRMSTGGSRCREPGECLAEQGCARTEERRKRRSRRGSGDRVLSARGAGCPCSQPDCRPWASRGPGEADARVLLQ